MKIIAYTALHYGLDYLYWAIRSVIDHVDEYYVLYSAEGSHGARSEVRCPESRQQLYIEAKSAAGDKLHWIDGEWEHEGFQRESILQYAPDADVILVLDADEIWGPGLASNIVSALKYADAHGLAVNVKSYRLPIIHYWRSFHRAVLHDPAFPTRVVLPKGEPNEAYFDTQGLVINHMGYAQRPDIVWYKQITHGHRAEWRKDIDWFAYRFMNNAQFDCHPVGSDYWNPEPVMPLDYMPGFMSEHPYFNMEVIE